MHKVTITINSDDDGASDTVDAIAAIIRENVPGKVEGEDGTKNFRVVYVETDEAIAKHNSAMYWNTRPKLRGCKLYTDDDDMRAAFSHGKTLDEEAIEARWPGLWSSIDFAMTGLKAQDAPAAEIFVKKMAPGYGYEVRVSASEHYNRVGSGWVVTDPKLYSNPEGAVSEVG